MESDHPEDFTAQPRRVRVSEARRAMIGRQAAEVAEARGDRA